MGLFVSLTPCRAFFLLTTILNFHILTTATSLKPHKFVQRQRRLIVRYNENAKVALDGLLDPQLHPVGVSMVHSSPVDRLAILQGSIKSIEKAAKKLRKIAHIEDDIIFKPQVQIQPQCQKICLNNDEPVSPGSNEVLPYGIQMTVGTGGLGPGSTTLLDSDVFVCLLDTGIDIEHPDLKKNSFSGCTMATREDSMCRFYPYNITTDPHGTHVVGTMAAIRGNGIGVIGVVPYGMNIIGANVLPSGDGGGPLSLLLDGLSRCETELNARKNNSSPNARAIVNMSFGSSDKSVVLEDMLNRMFQRGDMLFVAAAGNDQLTAPGEYMYPASYNSTISVGAVNCTAGVADFSLQNDQVSLVAPGVGVLSTIPPQQAVAIQLHRIGRYGVQSAVPYRTVIGSGYGSVTAPVVDCGYGTSPCTQGKKKVCLIQRGGITFGCKVKNAQLGGCAAVLLYNDVNPPCSPLEAATLVNPTCSPLGTSFPPTLALSLRDGEALQLGAGSGEKVSISVKSTNRQLLYETQSGTSMSVPHVTGIAARLWGAYPNCTAQDIWSAMERGAQDLGPPGKDVIYGAGLVNMQGAYNALQNMECAGGPGAGLPPLSIQPTPSSVPAEAPSVPGPADSGPGTAPSPSDTSQPAPAPSPSDTSQAAPAPAPVSNASANLVVT